MKTNWSSKIIAIVLSFFWVWMGLAYHIMHFASINKAAYVFGILFIIQGLLFLYFGFRKEKLDFKYSAGKYGIITMAIILYALLIYPLLGYLQARTYPYTPTFGLPCPTTIFTLGLLLCTNKKLPLALLVIPFLWSIVGTSAALNLALRKISDY